MNKYNNIIGDFNLSISETNIAKLSMDADISTGANTTAPIQLTDDAEATQLIAEFEDNDGELCYADGSIMRKYTQLGNLFGIE